MHPLPGTIYGICGGLLPISEEFQERVQQDAEKIHEEIVPTQRTLSDTTKQRKSLWSCG